MKPTLPHRLVRGLLVAAVVILGSALVSPPAANAAWRGVYLGNQLSADCLDAHNGTWFSNGGKVQNWRCMTIPGGGTPWWNQVWYAEWDRGLDTTIRTPGPPVGPAKCLDAWPAPGYLWGYKVSVWDCNGQSQQLWDTGNLFGLIRNVRWNLCLDLALPAGNGSYVGLYPCRTNGIPQAPDSQVWVRRSP